MYAYWSMNVSSVHEVYKVVCENAQLPTTRPGEKGTGQQKQGGRGMDKRRDYQMSKKEQGAESCKPGVKERKITMYIHIWALCSIRPPR